MNEMTRMMTLTAASVLALGAAFVATTAVADRGEGMGMGEEMGQMRGGGLAGLDFAAIDADKDGKLTPAEIDAYRAAQAKALDADGDGMISAEELTAMHMRGAQERAEAMATMMIQRRDTDGDGKLSAAEMILRPMPARMLERIDTDKDGAVSEAEMEAAQARMSERRKGGKHSEKHGKMGHRGGQGGQGGQGDQGNN